ncbi:MAG: hypothetical protein ACHBN1_16735 [Heteroscytonema crispum UTEX LB 1556]
MQSDSNSSSDFAPNQDDPKARKLLIPPSVRRKFFLQFTFMTLVGWVVGGIASRAGDYILLTYFSNIVFAVIFSADQALVLRRYVSPWLWMLATSFGWLISDRVKEAWINYIQTIAASLNRTLSFEEIFILSVLSTLAYILSGIWLGLFQWMVLRRYVAGAWWWNFLPSISFFFISILVGLLSFGQNFIPEVNRTQILYWSGQGLTALILGVVPAIGLCTLKMNPRRITEISSSS